MRQRAASGRSVPSIRARLANALAIWSVLWGLAVGAAVWLAAAHEVDELLDETLQSSADLMLALGVQSTSADASAGLVPSRAGSDVRHYAWQIVAADGGLRARSSLAPETPWRSTPTAGFSMAPNWRVLGVPLAEPGQMLYVAQSLEERQEARLEVTLAAGLAALAVGLLGHLWLRHRVRLELQPLQALSDRLAAWDWSAAPHGGFGPAQRQELQPVTQALDELTARLVDRLAAEQAFVAHAAHALRTPLAGIDAQLAVAVRDCPQPLHDRLQRVRGGAARLQAVVAALMGLFRTGAALQRCDILLSALAARLPLPALQIHTLPEARINADEDLLSAALLNLLDNAHRHGAQAVWLQALDGNRLLLRDDGPGVDATRRLALQAALDSQSYEGVTGLGLMLADRVARAHGGRVTLAQSERGFAIVLELPVSSPTLEATNMADGTHAQ